MVWKLHISATLTWFSAASRRAISTDPAGTYRWKGARDAAEVSPLRHGFEMVDRFGGFHLDRPEQLMGPVGARHDQIGEDLHLSDPTGTVWESPMLATMSPFRFSRTCNRRMTRSCSSCSRTGRTRIGLTGLPKEEPTDWIGHERRNYSHSLRRSIEKPRAAASRSRLDADVVTPQNDAVIASAESVPAESAIRTILIVDDDRSVADTFSRMLKLEGFGVATALSAETGLELADSVRPDAIILDMRMPITNGLQFLRVVRSKPHLTSVPGRHRHRRLLPVRAHSA